MYTNSEQKEYWNQIYFLLAIHIRLPCWNVTKKLPGPWRGRRWFHLLESIMHLDGNRFVMSTWQRAYSFQVYGTYEVMIRYCVKWLVCKNHAGFDQSVSNWLLIFDHLWLAFANPCVKTHDIWNSVFLIEENSTSEIRSNHQTWDVLSSQDIDFESHWHRCS